MPESTIDRYRRERDEQYARRQTIEGELHRVSAERDVFAEEIARLRSEIERKDAALAEVRRISDDYYPSSAGESELALSEMREALAAALNSAEDHFADTGNMAESSRQGILDSSPQPHNPDGLKKELLESLKWSIATIQGSSGAAHTYWVDVPGYLEALAAIARAEGKEAR